VGMQVEPSGFKLLVSIYGATGWLPRAPLVVLKC
jgi:hypothetical protein